MRTIIQILIISIIWLTVSVKTEAQQQVTLDEVLAKVSESNASIAAGFDKEIAEESNKFYKSLLKPGVNLTADIPNYSKSSVPVTQPDGTIVFQSIRQASSNVGLSVSQVISATGGQVFATTQLNRFDDFSNKFKQYNGIPIRVGIIQPIFGYNPWKYRKDIEPLLLEEANRTFDIRVEEALTSATLLYYDILIADQNLKIAQTNETVNANLLTITDERLTLGKVSKDEKLQLEIELNQARLSLSQARYQRDNAIAALYTYLGELIPTDVSFVVPDVIPEANIDVALLLTTYNTNRPEHISFLRQLREADAQIAESNALFGPGATIRASFGLARGADNVSDIYTDPFTEQQANLGVTIPLLDWGKRKSAVQQARISREAVTANSEQQILELENDIRQRAYRFLSLQNEIILLRQIREKAEERATISNERYILGDIDITNLTIAQREKDQTQRNYINALRTLWVTYYELRALTGFDVVTNSEIQY